MKKKLLPIPSLCVLAALAAVLLLTHDFGHRPFRDLKTEDLASVKVQILHWKNADWEKDVKDPDRLVALLQKIRIYEEAADWGNPSGTPVIVELTYMDGHTAQIRVMDPVFVIDGVAFRTQRGPADALYEYALDLLDLG